MKKPRATRETSNELSCRVIVPSKSVKKMNFGLVFIAGSKVRPILYSISQVYHYIPKR